MPKTDPFLITVLDDAASISVEELTRRCGVGSAEIHAMIEEGIIEPAGDSPANWRFSGTTLRRVLTIQRLQRDLQVNLSGAALALELLDELGLLRERVRALEQLLFRA